MKTDLKQAMEEQRQKARKCQQRQQTTWVRMLRYMSPLILPLQVNLSAMTSLIHDSKVTVLTTEIG